MDLRGVGVVTVLKIIAVLVIGYLLGSVSVAVLLSKYVFKSDVRNSGSKNAGTTNMARVYGMSAGLLTLAGDVLKTVVSMLIGKALLGEMGFALSAMACIAGHCWPLFFNFKGGKGVAVCGGIAIMLGWKYVVSLIGLFFVIAVVTRYVSLGSLIAVAMLIPALFIFNDYGIWMYIMAIFMIVCVWYMHRGNIKRLLNGTESKFVPGKRKK